MGIGFRIASVQTARNLALVVTLLTRLAAPQAYAQPATLLTPNAVRIFVVNGADRPVALAEVKMSLGARSAVGRTDSTGVFRIDGLEPGDWHASVRRIGYVEAQVNLHLANGENAFTVTVDRVSPMLRDVNVVDEKTTSIRIADFEARRARGEPNAVITREQIKSKNPTTLSQMLRGMPGVLVVDDFGTKTAIASRGSVPARGATVTACPMRIAVDGLMRPVGTSLDDTVINDVHGIEVYYGPARLPMQLATFRTDKWCGLVAIWTRDK